MNGILEEATHKEWGPVLIADYVVGPVHVYAVVYTRKGEVKLADLDKLTVLWHYDEGTAKFERDFPDED